MKRPKKHRSRRQWALSLGALALGLVLVTAGVTMALPLSPRTPSQIMAAAAQQHGARATHLVAKSRFHDMDFFLSANDDLFLLSYDPVDLGLSRAARGSSTPAADRTRSSSPVCGVGLHISDGDVVYTQVAGLVSLEDAVTARVTLPPAQPGTEPSTLDTAVLQGEDGQRYFWLCQETPQAARPSLSGVSIVLLDQQGASLAHYDLPEETQCWIQSA